jgi:hypothetical protein
VILHLPLLVAKADHQNVDQSVRLWILTVAAAQFYSSNPASLSLAYQQVVATPMPTASSQSEIPAPPLFRLGTRNFQPYVSQPSKTIEKPKYRKYFTAVHRDNIGRREVCDFSLKIKYSESSGRQPICSVCWAIQIGCRPAYR